jgi:hypothetical protein
MRALILGMVALLSGCVSTRVSTTWTNRRVEEVPKKVLVTADAPMASVRHRLEEELADKLRDKGFVAVPYTRLNPIAPKPKPEAIQDVLEKGNFDGLLVSRYVGSTQEVDYSPGMGWYGYGPYYGPYSYWGGYWNVTEAAHIETTLYGTEGSRPEPIWSGSSSTFASGAYGTAMSTSDIRHFSKVIANRLTRDLG